MDPPPAYWYPPPADPPPPRAWQQLFHTSYTAFYMKKVRVHDVMAPLVRPVWREEYLLVRTSVASFASSFSASAFAAHAVGSALSPASSATAMMRPRTPRVSVTAGGGKQRAAAWGPPPSGVVGARRRCPKAAPTLRVPSSRSVGPACAPLDDIVWEPRLRFRPGRT